MTVQTVAVTSWTDLLTSRACPPQREFRPDDRARRAGPLVRHASGRRTRAARRRRGDRFYGRQASRTSVSQPRRPMPPHVQAGARGSREVTVGPSKSMSISRLSGHLLRNNGGRQFRHAGSRCDPRAGPVEPTNPRPHPNHQPQGTNTPTNPHQPETRPRPKNQLNPPTLTTPQSDNSNPPPTHDSAETHF